MDGRPHRVGNVFIEHLRAVSSHSGGVVPLAPFFEIGDVSHLLGVV